MWSSSPIEATSRSESGATGRRSTRWFQGLESGKTGQAGAWASRGAEAEAAPAASTVARTKSAAAFLIRLTVRTGPAGRLTYSGGSVTSG